MCPQRATVSPLPLTSLRALLMALLMASILAFGAFFAGAAPIRAAQDQTPQSHPTAAEEDSPSQRFAQLIAAHDEWRLTVFPEYALRRGIDTRAGELTDSSLAGAYKRNAWIENQAWYEEDKQEFEDYLASGSAYPCTVKWRWQAKAEGRHSHQ